MILRGGRRRGAPAAALKRVLPWVTLLALLCWLLPAVGAAPARVQLRAFSTNTTRPTEAVAYARIALVRVLSYYDGTVNSDPVPTPSPSPCAADGVLVGTTGGNLNALSYVLTPTAAVNPTTPCQGAQAAFQQLYGRANTWSISHIDILLNVAYTGTGDKQAGAMAFSIDPSQIRTNGGPTAPELQVVALSVGAGAPTHDLPVLSLPQPSDAPAEPAANVVLDLTGADGQPLGRDAVTRDEVTKTLYPIDVPASAAGAVTTAGSTTGGTPQPTAAPLNPQLGDGALLIDANGRLVGMIVADAQGKRSVAAADDIRRAIGPVTSASGSLMKQWQQGLTEYYDDPPQFAQAATVYGALAAAYPDFGGVTPFLTAATAQSLTIPALVTPPIVQTTPSGQAPGGGLSKQTLIILVSMTFAALVVLIAALLLLLRRRRQQRALLPLAVTPPEEAELDLLPRDLPLDALGALLGETPGTNGAAQEVDAQPTQPLAAVPLGLDAVATMKMPSIEADQWLRRRTGLALMPIPAGLTDPGLRRAGDPNQDNIFAAQGIRLAGGRLQPYGLFIVADGMGGHLNGQEASRLAIEIVGTTILQVLTSPQPVDETTLRGMLRDGVQHASAMLRERNLTQQLDMGTTMTAALVVDDIAYVVNVGDSRTYLMSPELGLRQVTTDHSVVASLAAAGVIRPDDIYSHPRRNQIYRSLGGGVELVEVDTFEVPLQAGDKLLLCSDGLWEMVRDPQIERILRGTADPQQAVELLVREANANGGEDNISAVVVRFVEDMPQQQGMRVVAAPPSPSAQPPPQG
jgi:serine/threonine protein phosphatase PrpC